MPKLGGQGEKWKKGTETPGVTVPAWEEEEGTAWEKVSHYACSGGLAKVKAEDSQELYG